MSRILTLDEAAEALVAGQVVAIPTETVYGLAANALDETAVAKIFTIKGRPHYNPIICHLPTAEAVFRYGEGSAVHQQLAEQFWPGPLTLLLEHHGRISKLVSASLPQAGFRVPEHKLCLDLLHRCGVPLAAPSANLSTRRSPTSAAMVLSDLGENIAGVVDGGPCRIGLESTVVRVCSDQLQILRPGGISREIFRAKGFVLRPSNKVEVIKVAEDKQQLSEHRQEVETDQLPLSPGALKQHYQSTVPLLLILSDKLRSNWWQSEKFTQALQSYRVSINQACYLAFGQEDIPKVFGQSLNFSRQGDLKEAAHNFFSYLDAAGSQGTKILVSHLLPHQDLGYAINDRLLRAASLRIAQIA